MREHHRLYQPDPARQRGCTEVGKRVQYVDREEQDAEPAFLDAKAAKKPIRDQRVAKQSATEAINGKEPGQPPDGGFRLLRYDRLVARSCHLSNLDFRGEEEVQKTA